MRFCLHMLHQGVINSEQLVDALSEQLDGLTPLGQLAIEEGKMSARQVFTVLRRQAESESGHDRFGAIAMELGFLTRQDVANLLLTQSDRRKPLQELLVRRGAVSQDVVSQEFHHFVNGLQHWKSGDSRHSRKRVRRRLIPSRDDSAVAPTP